MTKNSPYSKTSVVMNTALLLGIFVVLATVLRAMVAREIEPVAVSVAAVCAALLFVVWRQVRTGAPADVAAVIVLVIAFFVYGSLTWISDGFSGSIIFAAPMLPLLAGLMLSKRAARNITMLAGIFLLVVLARHLSGDMVADPDFPDDLRYSMRLVILLLMLVAINWVIAYYAMIEQASGEVAALEETTKDPLTGLLLREDIDKAAAREFDAARREESNFSLALVEIDNYASLVEKHGQNGAENCLLGVADALRYCVRRTSDALGRFSDTRLCILMNDKGPGMNRVTEKFHGVIETLDIPIDPEHTTRVTVSIGICAEPARGLHTPEEIITGAATALDRAIQAGGNRREWEQLTVDQ